MIYKNINESILKEVREGVNAPEEFDKELIIHINSALGTLYQNGVGHPLFISDDTSTWSDLIDEKQVEGNKMFSIVPLYIMMSVKIVFDPPPPSIVEYYKNHISELLWRLKVAYTDDYNIERG